jgi:hypothetical protein
VLLLEKSFVILGCLWFLGSHKMLENRIPNSEVQIEYQNIKQEFSVNIHVRVAMASKNKRGSNY